jgi:hypothetical protein
MKTPKKPSANYCEKHRKGGITSSTVSAKPCTICGRVPTKTGEPLEPSELAKPVRGWAIIGPDCTMRNYDKNRQYAIADATWELGISGGLAGLKKQGYRCIRVVVLPL